jgi:eukaryotic-like serine/threonine-protein kinase
MGARTRLACCAESLVSIDRDRLRTGGALTGALARRALPTATHPRELEPGDVVGAFRIVHELSRGGMAVVYLAERADGEFAQRVALKWMAVAGDRTAAEALFRRERQTLAGLEHPGIARLIDGGRSADAMLWFAMELVEGEPIDAWCRSRKASREQRVRLVLALCEALAFAHGRLLIHRDIKPANVLVDQQGRIKLLDFGIARLADQNDLVGNFALTPGYASPEQWRGESVTVSSDVYQTGLLLAAILGVLPAQSGDAHVTALQTGEAPTLGPTSLPQEFLAGLPRDLAAIVRRATALEPTARYPTITALAEDLARNLARLPVQARAGGIFYRIGCFLRRQPFVAAGAALAISLLVAFSWRIAIERDVARQQAERATEQAQRAETVLEFLSGLLAWATPQKHRGEEKTVSEALAYGVEQVRINDQYQPSMRAQMLYMLGNMYSQRKERERSRSLYGEAYEVLRKNPETDALLRADAAYGLAAQLSDAPDRERSLLLIDEAMTLYGDHAERAEKRIHAWRLKAIRLNQDGQLDQAIAENRAALVSATQRLGRENTATARVIQDLSGQLSQAGYDDEALPLKREGYEILRRLYGEDHPDTSLAAMGLAGLLVARGDYAEADALIASDGEVRKRLWGDQHTEYARHLYLLASYRLQIGKMQQAQELIERAIAINQASGAVGRTALSMQYELLGRTQEQLGNLPASLESYRRGQDPELFGAKLGWDGGDLALGAARALRKLGRVDQVDAELDRAAALWRDLPAQHPSLLSLEIERAFANLQRGDTQVAHEQADHARRLLPARPEWDAARNELKALDDKLIGAETGGLSK